MPIPISIIPPLKSFMSVWNDFVNPDLAEEEKNVALAQAIKNNRCSSVQSDQDYQDQLEDILSSPENSAQFFNDPMVQERLVEGLIADTYMDERVLQALQTCTPSLSTSQQQDLFDNQFSWLSHNPLTPNAEIASRFFTEIRLQQETCTNPKFTPYPSDKRSNQTFNLNGQATLEGSSERIVCRHLATAILDEIHPVTHKISYENFNSAEKIAQHIKSDIETRYVHIKRRATEVHLIKNANWGQFIASQFEEMDRQGIPIKKMLMQSSNHGMAVWLRIKIKDGKKWYVIHFYDPNSTTTHTRAKAYDLANVKNWVLGAFIDVNGEQRKQFYYPETQAVSLIYIVPEADELSSENVQHKQHNQPILPVDRKLTRYDVNWDAITIYHLMIGGFAGTLKEVALQSNTLAQSGTDLLTLLNAKCANGTPGLFMALQEGHANAIRAYGELLTTAGISSSDLLTLLSAKGADGTPGLSMALQDGHADAIRAYGELLTTAGISSSDLLTLLSAKRADGIPGLYFALKNRHADAMRVYGELLTAAGISGPDLLTLLSAKGANGAPGLYMALQNGDANAIRAYGELLTAAEISGPDLLTLLSAKRANGTPGLYFALLDGHADAIRAYGELLKEARAARKISDTDFLTLLSAKGTNGTPGLYMALQNGHADAIRAYGELLTAAGKISDTVFLTLLSAKRADGIPGLFMALQDGHADAIRAYGELLTTAGISSPDLLTLLSAKGADGIPGLYMALQDGHADAIRAYGELLTTAGISGENLLTIPNLAKLTSS